MAICQSRKNMHSVMANSKFGNVVLYKGSYVVELQQDAINQTTMQIKKFVQKQLDRLDQLTIAEVLHLQRKYGMGVSIK